MGVGGCCGWTLEWRGEKKVKKVERGKEEREGEREKRRA